MWGKTLVGFLVSLLLTLSLMMNMIQLIALPQDVLLLIAFVGGFLLWGGIMTVFYCADNLKKPLLYSAPLLLASVVANSLIYVQASG